jgi:hypothetical protein
MSSSTVKGGASSPNVPCPDPLQIDLMYPMSKERASKAAADAGKLGFNRVPQV